MLARRIAKWSAVRVNSACSVTSAPTAVCVTLRHIMPGSVSPVRPLGSSAPGKRRISIVRGCDGVGESFGGATQSFLHFLALRFVGQLIQLAASRKALLHQRPSSFTHLQPFQIAFSHLGTTITNASHHSCIHARRACGRRLLSLWAQHEAGKNRRFES